MERSAGRGAVTLVVATLACALCYAMWGLVAPLAPLFRVLYGLTDTNVGLLVAAPVLAGALASGLLGPLTDRLGGRAVLALLLLLLVAPALLAGSAVAFGPLLVASGALGVAGGAFPVGAVLAARWFAGGRPGLALGIYGLADGGLALASLTVPPLADTLGWPLVFGLGVPALFVGAAVCWALVRDAPRAASQSARATERRAPARLPALGMLALCYGATFGGLLAVAMHLPALLGAFGLVPADAGAWVAGLVAVAAIARPLGGSLSDRWGSAAVLRVALGGLTALLLALAVAPGSAALAALPGIAAALGLGNGAAFAWLAALAPARPGTAAGVVSAAGALGSFVPLLALGGAHAATGAYTVGFVLLATLVAACLVVGAPARQRGTRPPLGSDEGATAP